MASPQKSRKNRSDELIAGSVKVVQCDAPNEDWISAVYMEFSSPQSETAGHSGLGW